MSDDVLKAIDEAQAVITAVYVIPTAGKVAQAAGELKNSVALADATGTLLQKILEHAGEKTACLAELVVGDDVRDDRVVGGRCPVEEDLRDYVADDELREVARGHHHEQAHDPERHPARQRPACSSGRGEARRAR